MPRSGPFRQISNILQLVGIIAGVVLPLLGPRVITTVLGIIIIFLCAAPLVWHLSWAERYGSRQVLLVLLLAVACLWFGYLTWPENKIPTPELHGLLIPANEPDPPNWCRTTSVPRNVLNVRLGTIGLITPQSHLSISSGGLELFAVTRANGGIKISARIIDASNEVVAQISDNELYVNPSSRFKMLRPDWHSLIIIDELGKEKKRVLDVYFANPRFVRVYGRFFAAGGEPLILEERFTAIGTNTNIGAGLQCMVFDGDEPQTINLGGTELVAQ